MIVPITIAVLWFIALFCMRVLNLHDEDKLTWRTAFALPQCFQRTKLTANETRYDQLECMLLWERWFAEEMGYKEVARLFERVQAEISPTTRYELLDVVTKFVDAGTKSPRFEQYLKEEYSETLPLKSIMENVVKKTDGFHRIMKSYYDELAKHGMSDKQIKELHQQIVREVQTYLDFEADVEYILKQHQAELSRVIDFHDKYGIGVSLPEYKNRIAKSERARDDFFYQSITKLLDRTVTREGMPNLQMTHTRVANRTYDGNKWFISKEDYFTDEVQRTVEALRRGEITQKEAMKELGLKPLEEAHRERAEELKKQAEFLDDIMKQDFRMPKAHYEKMSGEIIDV